MPTGAAVVVVAVVVVVVVVVAVLQAGRALWCHIEFFFGEVEVYRRTETDTEENTTQRYYTDIEHRGTDTNTHTHIHDH